MRWSRTLGVVGLLALLLLATGVRADRDRAGAAAPLTPGLERAAAAEGTSVEPLVTLSLRVTGKRLGGGATVTIKGTFRGRAVAGRRTYRLLPVGRAIATHRHGTAAPQRARVQRVFVDVSSDSEYLRVVGSGPLVGGPAITGPGGTCERIAFRFTVRPKRGTAVLRWTCRRAGADRSPPIHLDVLESPRDTIVSSYTIVRRPCSPAPTSARAVGAVADVC
jgi:hypothetical protein